MWMARADPKMTKAPEFRASAAPPTGLEPVTVRVISQVTDDTNKGREPRIRGNRCGMLTVRNGCQRPKWPVSGQRNGHCDRTPRPRPHRRPELSSCGRLVAG